MEGDIVLLVNASGCVIFYYGEMHYFVSDRCHRGYAAMTPVRYERDIQCFDNSKENTELEKIVSNKCCLFNHALDVARTLTLVTKSFFLCNVFLA